MFKRVAVILAILPLAAVELVCWLAVGSHPDLIGRVLRWARLS